MSNNIIKSRLVGIESGGGYEDYSVSFLMLPEPANLSDLFNEYRNDPKVQHPGRGNRRPEFYEWLTNTKGAMAATNEDIQLLNPEWSALYD